MHRIFLIAAAALSVASCSTYLPSPAERIHIVDSPADIRACRHLGAVGDMVATGPGFVHHVDRMLSATLALGGTDLFLRRTSSDWAFVHGVAYRCPFERPTRAISHILRARG